jgi:hypothetical protein
VRLCDAAATFTRCSQELDKKIKISRSKLEESRGKLRGIHTEMTEGGRVKERSLKAAEHRLEVVTSRLNQTVGYSFERRRAPSATVVDSDGGTASDASLYRDAHLAVLESSCTPLLPLLPSPSVLRCTLLAFVSLWACRTSPMMRSSKS